MHISTLFPLLITVKFNDRLSLAALMSLSLLQVRFVYESSAYLRAALISTTGKTLRGIYRKLSEVDTRCAQFSIKYVHLKLFYEPSFKSFPTLKLQNSQVGRSLISQVVLMYIKCRIKGGVLICKYPNQRHRANSRAPLIKLFSFKVRCLFESGSYSSSGA